MHPIYSYAVVTDAEEGVILVNVETFADGEARNNFLRRAITFNPDGRLTGARHVTLAGTVAYISTDAGIVVLDLDVPTSPRIASFIPISGARSTAVQFRYLYAAAPGGVRVYDITAPLTPIARPGGTIPAADPHRIYLARTYAYIAAGREGLLIADIEKPLTPRIYARIGAESGVRDARDVVIGSTNASLFAYLADGEAGFKVFQLTSPSSQPNFYGFSPEPKPELIAWRRTRQPALSVSRGLDRDRAVDETGHQIAVFGRLGSRPFNRGEMEGLFRTGDGRIYRVDDRAAP